MSRTVFITGANRGLGLEFVKQLLARGDKVHATCRNPDSADALQALKSSGDLTIHACDVTDEKQIRDLQNQLSDVPFDIVINNAGTSGETGQTLGNFSLDNIKNVFAVNSFAPVVVADAFMMNLEKGDDKTIVNITSRMGSIADNDSGRSYAYRSSKTALNSLMYSMSVDLKDTPFRVLLLHPGWVKTDMGGDNALVTAEDSVAGMLKLIDDPATKSGGFYHYEGYELPW